MRKVFYHTALILTLFGLLLMIQAAHAEAPPELFGSFALDCHGPNHVDVTVVLLFHNRNVVVSNYCIGDNTTGRNPWPVLAHTNGPLVGISATMGVRYTTTPKYATQCTKHITPGITATGTRAKQTRLTLECSADPGRAGQVPEGDGGVLHVTVLED